MILPDDYIIRVRGEVGEAIAHAIEKMQPGDRVTIERAKKNTPWAEWWQSYRKENPVPKFCYDYFGCPPIYTDYELDCWERDAMIEVGKRRARVK